MRPALFQLFVRRGLARWYKDDKKVLGRKLNFLVEGAVRYDLS